MNRKETLEEALKIVTKDRQNAYGTPEDNFNCIAVLWSAYLGHPITAKQVAILMILLKVARAKANPDYADNYVDICGYAACGAELDSPVNTDALAKYVGQTVVVPCNYSIEDLKREIGDSKVTCDAE